MGSFMPLFSVSKEWPTAPLRLWWIFFWSMAQRFCQSPKYQWRLEIFSLLLMRLPRKLSFRWRNSLSCKTSPRRVCWTITTFSKIEAQNACGLDIEAFRFLSGLTCRLKFKAFNQWKWIYTLEISGLSCKVKRSDDSHQIKFLNGESNDSLCQ